VSQSAAVPTTKQICLQQPLKLYVSRAVHDYSTSGLTSSAIAEGPRDALSQLKSCQLMHNCTKNHI